MPGTLLIDFFYWFYTFISSFRTKHIMKSYICITYLKVKSQHCYYVGHCKTKEMNAYPCHLYCCFRAWLFFVYKMVLRRFENYLWRTMWIVSSTTATVKLIPRDPRVWKGHVASKDKVDSPTNRLLQSQMAYCTCSIFQSNILNLISRNISHN